MTRAELALCSAELPEGWRLFFATLAATGLRAVGALPHLPPYGRLDAVRGRTQQQAGVSVARARRPGVPGYTSSRSTDPPDHREHSRCRGSLSARVPSVLVVDAETLKVLLTGAGALSELTGLWLVVQDAGDARRRASEVRRRDVTLYAGSARARAKGSGALTVTGGRVPTLEERVEALERELPRVRGELDDRIDRVDDAAQDAASHAGGEAKSHADDLDRSLRDFIAETLASSRARVGVVFFAAGVVASAAANIVG
jgi:hypothetical protein